MTLRVSREVLSVVHACHPDKTRYAMDGVLIREGAAYATNGKILARLSPVDDGTALRALRASGDAKVTERVISAKSVRVLRSAIGKQSGAYAEIESAPQAEYGPDPTDKKSERSALLEGARVYRPARRGVKESSLSLAQIEGHFPPVDDVIPPTFGPWSIAIDMPVDELSALCGAADIARAVGAEDYENNSVRWVVSDLGIRISARYMEAGIKAQWTWGSKPPEAEGEAGSVLIGLNPSLGGQLAQVAADAGIEEVRLRFNPQSARREKSSDHPVIITGRTKAKGTAGLELLALWMPLSLG